MQLGTATAMQLAVSAVTNMGAISPHATKHVPHGFGVPYLYTEICPASQRVLIKLSHEQTDIY